MPRRRVVQALWSGRSIRAQLLLVFVLIDLVAVFIAGGIAIWRARTQTRIEVAASMRLAELLVRDAVNLVHQRLPAEQFLASLPAQLRSLRHVRIVVKDDAGIPLPLSASAAGEKNARAVEHAPAPAWFTGLVAPPMETHRVPALVDGRSIGEIEIIGEPADEIAEVWDNAVAIGTLAATLNIAMVGILYVLFGRVLDPLNLLTSGISDLERQTYTVRLPPFHARELAAIAEHFNALARALETLRAENLQLNRRLITAQDDERRRTALELHDEVGPCLFGLRACISSVTGLAGSLPENARQRVTEGAEEMLAIIEHLQAINRTMLQRLRPMALGHVPLGEMIDQLVNERARQHPQIGFAFTAGKLARSYGDSVDLTVYRCVQEGLTNAIRHAQPKHVAVSLGIASASSRLELTVRDDGRGITAATLPGFGLRGMRERVEGLGGRYCVEAIDGGGTCIAIAIPIVDLDDANAADTTTTGESA